MNSEDLPDILELVQSRPSFSSVKDEQVLNQVREQQKANTLDMLSDSVIDSELVKVFGCRVDGELQGVLFTATSTQQASYYMTRAHTKPGCNPRVLFELWMYCIRVYESAGYFRFSTLFSRDSVESTRRLWKAEKTGYISNTELEIPSNTKPKQVEIWEKLYGRMLFPTPTVVRTFTRERLPTYCQFKPGLIIENMVSRGNVVSVPTDDELVELLKVTGDNHAIYRRDYVFSEEEILTFAGIGLVPEFKQYFITAPRSVGMIHKDGVDRKCSFNIPLDEHSAGGEHQFFSDLVTRTKTIKNERTIIRLPGTDTAKCTNSFKLITPTLVNTDMWHRVDNRGNDKPRVVLAIRFVGNPSFEYTRLALSELLDNV